MKKIVVVKGAGDIASGVIHKLHKSGFSVIALEVENPTAIRRNVCFSEAIYEDKMIVEGVEAVLCKDLDEIEQVLDSSKVAIVIDPAASIINELKPLVVIDAILAKKNIGLNINDAPIVIGIGPGFEAGIDCHSVIESSRGHNLGRVIYKGYAKSNTGIPGTVGGYTYERVLRAPESGYITTNHDIGDIVTSKDTIAYINGTTIKFEIDGLIRGLIRNNSYVVKGMKIGDIDARVSEIENCNTISDKARCIAGGVLEAILNLYMKL